MPRRVFVSIALMLMAAVVGSCGDQPRANQIQGPKVNFVGNDSCPTAGQSPYNGGNAPNTTGSYVGVPIDEMPHTHVTPPQKVSYMHDPPTSGCHYNVPASSTELGAPIPAGVWTQPIDPEHWVHNLEHGYIAVLYNCPSGCTSDVNTLHDWYKGLPTDPQLPSSCPTSYPKVIVLPETTMQPKFALVAWDWYDPMNTTLNMTEVQKFLDNHIDQGPEPGVC